MLREYKFKRIPRRVRSLARVELAESCKSVDLRNARIENLFSPPSLSASSKRFLRQIRRGPALGQGFPLSSDDVRLAAAIALIEATFLFAEENERLKIGRERLRLLTCSPSVGISNLEDGEFAVTRTKNTVERLVRRAPVSGLLMLDFGLFNPEALEPEDTLATHSHGIVSVASHCRLKVKELELLMSPADPLNVLGAPVTRLTARGSGRHAILEPDDILGLGRYSTKVSCGTNTLFEGKRGQRSQSNQRDWTAIGALRQLEVESYVDVLAACSGVGEVGRDLRLRWRRRFFELLNYDEQPRGSRIDVETRYSGWKRVWAEIDNGFSAADPEAIFATRAPR